MLFKFTVASNARECPSKAFIYAKNTADAYQKYDNTILGKPTSWRDYTQITEVEECLELEAVKPTNKAGNEEVDGS